MGSHPQRRPSAGAWQALLALCAAAVSTSCGTDAAPSSLDAGSSDEGSATTDAAKPDALGCSPPTLPDRWAPRWTPPHSPLSVCTMQQIEAIYGRCDYGSPDYSADDCRNYYS